MYIRWLLLASLFEVIGRIASVWMKANNHLDQLNKISLSTLGLNVLLNVYLIPIHGVWAAVFVSCFTYFLRATFSVYFIFSERGTLFVINMIPKPRDMVDVMKTIFGRTNGSV